jgi:hypothetical protein
MHDCTPACKYQKFMPLTISTFKEVIKWQPFSPDSDNRKQIIAWNQS